MQEDLLTAYRTAADKKKTKTYKNIKICYFPCLSI